MTLMASALSDRCELAKRHIVVYKLKKVGGTSLCLLLGSYAKQRNLTMSTGRRAWERNGAAAPSDAAMRAGEVDVMCQHGAAHEYARHYQLHGRRPVLHLAILRDPAEEFVSWFYYGNRTAPCREPDASRAPPTASEARRLVRHFAEEYTVLLPAWAQRGARAGADSCAAPPNASLIVLLFERMEQSVQVAPHASHSPEPHVSHSSDR